MGVIFFIGAQLCQHTFAAQGFARFANFAAMPDKPVMGIAPFFHGYCFLQFFFRCKRVCTICKPQPVRNAENMRIYGNGRHIVNNACYYIGRFFADTRQRHQLFNGIWHGAVVFLHQHMARKRPQSRISFSSSSCVSAPIFSGVLYLGKMRAVILLTRSSVHWADIITATKSSNGEL